MKVTILFLSQLTRDIENSGDNIPKLEKIKNKDCYNRNKLC